MATSARKNYINFASPPFEEEIFSGPQLVSAEDEALAAPVTESPGHSWFGAISEALNPKGQRRIRISHLLTDLSFVLVNAYVGFCLVTLYGPGQRRLPELLHPVHGSTGGIAFLMLYAVLIALCCQNYGLYRARRTRSEMQEKIAVCKAVLLATFLFICFLWLSGNKPVSRLLIAFAGVLNVVSFVLWRTWTRQSLDRRVATGKTGRNVAILGATAVGLRLAHTLQRTRGLGYVVRGFVDDNHPSNGVRVLGTVDQLHDVLRGEFIDEIFITPPFDPGLVTRVAAEAAMNHVEVKLVPEFWGTVSKPAPLDYVGEFPVFALHREPIPEFALFVKRTLDVLASGIALFMLSPLFLAIAAAVRMDSPGPVFYSALRIGKKGRRFAFYKFRTMVQNADAMKNQFRDLNERKGPTFKIANDPRITRVGHFLRRYSIDELPQLWNVLKGDMSLVGPRPHPLDDCQQYSLDHLRRLDVTPGMTGLWQVSARSDPSFATNMKLDLDYIENWGPWLDIKIILKTLPTVLKGSGQ